MNSFPRGSPAHSADAFTLVEIMIAATIIGLLAMIAIPAISRVQQTAKNNRFVSDLRIFTQAFETYALENGNWPPNAGTGVVPAGMNTAITARWSTPRNSLGGRWNWDRNNFVAAGIATVNVTVSDLQMILIDRKIDDGDLNSGNFQKFDTRFIYILER